MTTASLAADRSTSRDPQRLWPRLAGAELMKLRKRRGLFWSTLVLVVAPVVVGYIVPTLQHAVDPDHAGPAGGITNLRSTYEFLAQVGVVAAIMVGVTAGGGDLGAGVFRELVVTGRSRIALFGVRFPGGILFLAPYVLAAAVLASVASVALPSSESEPGALLMVEYAGWLALALLTGFALALGVGSLLSGRVAIGLLLAWQFILTPLLLGTGKLDPVLVAAALRRIEPSSTNDSVSPAIAVLTIVAWTVIPLLAGAWHTARRDA
jgi:hypothetical protein